MCLAYVALSAQADWPLFIAANRDEFHERPTLPARPWPELPHIIAGRDLQGGGTWLGMTLSGRFALLTNYRDTSQQKMAAASRGKLVQDFLEGSESPLAYADRVQQAGPAYNGFNLIVGNLHSAFYVSNRSQALQPQALERGRYLLSNHLLNTPWPKAERLRLSLDALPPDALDRSLNPIFELLKDGNIAADDELPKTGLSLERERLLSSPFIVSAEYGTRCSTVIAIHASGRAMVSEVSYDESGHPSWRHDWPFVIENGRSQ